MKPDIGLYQGRQIINSANSANRLSASNSPYLLQHAYNPVDWHEWSNEAFALAKKQNRLIFLSIGYSTCHWCHVMEKESFEDEEVAALINSAYVAIKVDREQRPDIDQIYMDVCQAITGSGGWPLTLVLTPDQKPIFAGTYFSKRQKHGRPGLIEILSAIAAEWKLDSQKFLESAEQISAHFGRSKVSATRFPDEEIVTRGIAEISADYDPLYGGFTSAPKFPMGHVLELLLNYSINAADNDLLARVEHSLLAMCQGGIFDHIGGGFCRYSTDERWLVPHFEKMLYDNALLLRLYAAAYKATGKVIYKEVAEAVSTYVIRDLKSSDAGFYSAEDADSEGHEGKFYVFSCDEFMQLAGEENATLLAEYFGVTSAGNFEGGQNILHLRQNTQEYCSRHGLDGADFSKRLEEFRQKLFVYRSRRIRPALDDKVITSWNGLIIGALALAGRYLGRSDLIESAQHASAFIKKNLTTAEGRLMRCWRNGKAEIDGFFEDYAFLVQGLLELFRSDYNLVWLQWAIELQKKATELFADHLPGSYFETPHDGEKLLFRPQNFVDGAVPCARAIFADNCVMLASITGNNSFVDMATAIFADAADLMMRAPSATTVMLNALRRYYQSHRIFILTDKLSEAEDFAAAIEEFYLPDSVILLAADKSEEQMLKSLLTDPEIFSSSRPVIQICQRNSCLAPIKSKSELLAVLARISGARQDNTGGKK